MKLNKPIITFNLQLLASTDYEKMYNELKQEHDTLTTTFNTYKETTEKEKTDLQTNLDNLKKETDKEIADLKQANISLYLKIPQEPREEQKPQEQKEDKTTCEDIIKMLGGN